MIRNEKYRQHLEIQQLTRVGNFCPPRQELHQATAISVTTTGLGYRDTRQPWIICGQMVTVVVWPHTCRSTRWSHSASDRGFPQFLRLRKGELEFIQCQTQSTHFSSQTEVPTPSTVGGEPWEVRRSFSWRFHTQPVIGQDLNSLISKPGSSYLMGLPPSQGLRPGHSRALVGIEDIEAHTAAIVLPVTSSEAELFCFSCVL